MLISNSFYDRIVLNQNCKKKLNIIIKIGQIIQKKKNIYTVIVNREVHLLFPRNEVGDIYFFRHHFVYHFSRTLFKSS